MDTNQCASYDVQNSLYYCRIHKLSIDAIAQHALPKLLHLDVTGSFIGPSGAQTVAKRLDTAKNLRSLIMTRNLIESTGIVAIARALCDVPSLTLLDVTSNGRWYRCERNGYCLYLVFS